MPDERRILTVATATATARLGRIGTTSRRCPAASSPHPALAPSTDKPEPSARSALQGKTDLCVQCGLCLPHCPTYALYRIEGESPRGRLALIQGALTGALHADARLSALLDHCLSCQACEAVCPSRVPFGEIMDEARAMLEPARHRTPAARLLRRGLLDGLVPHGAALRLAGRLLRVYQRSGLQAVARRGGLLGARRLADAEALLPPLAPVRRWRSRYAAQPPHRGVVALFIGCVASVADRPNLEAAVRVLTRLGFEVRIPRNQTCCGALHRHEAAPEAERRLARRNLEAFGDSDVPIVSLASGCCAQLVRYGTLLATPGGAAFATRVYDINRFLVESPWPADAQPAPLRARVAVHEPCTLRNALHGQDKPYRLLERIPGLDVIPLGGGAHCCGAAGAHLLHYAEDARRLREPKLQAVHALRPRFVVTSNIGCALHLAAGLRSDPQAPEVLHPVTLLDRQLRAGATRSD